MIAQLKNGNPRMSPGPTDEERTGLTTHRVSALHPWVLMTSVGHILWRVLAVELTDCAELTTGVQRAKPFTEHTLR